MHTGRWLVDGNPQIVLMDIGSAAWKLDEYKSELWNKCNLGIPHLDIEANDAVILGYMVADFVEEVSSFVFVPQVSLIRLYSFVTQRNGTATALHLE